MELGKQVLDKPLTPQGEGLSPNLSFTWQKQEGWSLVSLCQRHGQPQRIASDISRHPGLAAPPSSNSSVVLPLSSVLVQVSCPWLSVLHPPITLPAMHSLARVTF